MADISFNIACKELKIAQIAQLNPSFQLLHLVHIHLFRERLSKKEHATIPKVNMGYDQYTVPVTLVVKTSCFPLACANIRPLPLMPFFQISLKNGELKTTHNTFRDCRVLFFRQPFSK